MIDDANIQEKDILRIPFRGKKGALKWPERSTMALDKNGVLLYKIPYTDKFDYYPIFIARYSLNNLQEYLDTRNSKYQKIFFNQVDWLFKNLTIKEDIAVWEHQYVLPFYDFNKSVPERISDYFDIEPEILLDKIKNFKKKYDKMIFLGTAQERYREILKKSSLKPIFTSKEHFYPRAEHIYLCRDKDKLSKDYESIIPFYLRKSDAEEKS